ncbi:MAG: hypothetical protein ACRCW1_00555 [Anaerotignaceae bacterium]
MSILNEYKNALNNMIEDRNRTKSEAVKSILQSKIDSLQLKIKQLEKEKSILEFNKEFENKNVLVYGTKQGIKKQ